MPYYISSYIGRGTRTDPFRPVGYEQAGWSAIDLRPDGGATRHGQGLNACLLHVPQHDPSLVKVADERTEVLSPQSRRRFMARFHLDSPFTRFHECVADMLLLPPTGAWARVRDQRIYLGGLLWFMPAMAGMTTITESWTHADTSTGDANGMNADLTWTKELNGNWSILSNRASFANAPDNNRLRAESDLATVNMDVQVTLVSIVNNPVGGNANYFGPMARMSASVITTGYTFYAVWDTNVGSHQLWKTIANAYTQLGSSDATDPGASEVLKVRANGSSITGFLNGSTSVGPITDSAIDGTTVGGKRGGIDGFSHNISAANAVFDDWSAADFASGGSAGLSGSAGTGGSGTSVPNFQIPL